MEVMELAHQQTAKMSYVNRVKRKMRFLYLTNAVQDAKMQYTIAVTFAVIDPGTFAKLVKFRYRMACVVHSVCSKQIRICLSCFSSAIMRAFTS